MHTLGLSSLQAVQAASELEGVVVAGSYIKDPVDDEPLPITTFATEDLTLSGSPTTLDLIKRLSFSQDADGEADDIKAGAGADRATVSEITSSI